MVRRIGVIASLLLAISSSALALTVDADGSIASWGLNPFTQAGSAAGNHYGWEPAQSGIYWMEQNNFSPVNYPGGIGHQPSPGGALGEHTDIEALYWRASGANLQVLLALSSGDSFHSAAWNTTYRIGDLFIDVDGSGYSFAVANTNVLAGSRPWQSYDPSTKAYSVFSHNAAPGSLFALNGDEMVGVVGRNIGGYGDDAAIRQQVGPWAIDQSNADFLDLIALEKASFDYGMREGGGYHHGSLTNRLEDNTWFFEYTIPMSLLGLTPEGLSTLGLHVTFECGNDYIRSTDGLVHFTQPDGAVIPEPITLAALSMGLASLWGYSRRRIGGRAE